MRPFIKLPTHTITPKERQPLPNEPNFSIAGKLFELTHRLSNIITVLLSLVKDGFTRKHTDGNHIQTQFTNAGVLNFLILPSKGTKRPPAQ